MTSLRRPNPPTRVKGASLSHDGLELRKRRRGGGRGRRGADDAGRAVPDQRGAGRAALQVPQGAPGPPRRPQPRGEIDFPIGSLGSEMLNPPHDCALEISAFIACLSCTPGQSPPDENLISVEIIGLRPHSGCY